MHCFAEMMVWVNYDKSNADVRYGVNLVASQVFLAGFRERPGDAGRGVPPPGAVPVSMKRLRELGLASAGDEDEARARSKARRAEAQSEADS